MLGSINKIIWLSFEPATFVPKLLKEGITKEEVEKIQKEIEILGGKVIIE